MTAPIRIKVKTSPSDVVTQADLDAEKAMIAKIRELRPDDAIISEETALDDPNLRGNSGYVWVIDPLDGSKNLVEGLSPEYATVAAVRRVDGLDHEVPEYVGGAILKPVTGEWVAGSPERAWKGSGSWGQREVARVADKADLRGAFFATNLAEHDPEKRAAHSAQILVEVLPYCNGFRGSGSSACDALRTIQGKVHANLITVKGEWDRAAALAIVPGAGGLCRVVPDGPYTAYAVGSIGPVNELADLIVANHRPAMERRAAPSRSGILTTGAMPGQSGSTGGVRRGVKRLLRKRPGPK